MSAKSKTMASKVVLPKLNNQLDYISLILPIGRFTASRSGFKASGNITNEMFDKLVNFYDNFKGTNGEAMTALTDVKTLEKIIPNWNVVPIHEDFKVNDTVTFTEPLFKKKYSGNYLVTAVKPKYVFIKTDSGNAGFPKETLTIVKKA